MTSHLESKLTTLSKDGLLLGWRALMATGGATGASDHGRPCKWSKSADQIPALVKRFYQKTENTLCGELWIHMTSHLESKLTTLSKDGLLLGRRALMATGGATGASDHGEPFKWSKSVKRFCQKTQKTLCREL